MKEHCVLTWEFPSPHVFHRDRLLHGAGVSRYKETSVEARDDEETCASTGD